MEISIEYENLDSAIDDIIESIFDFIDDYVNVDDAMRKNSDHLKNKINQILSDILPSSIDVEPPECDPNG